MLRSPARIGRRARATRRFKLETTSGGAGLLEEDGPACRRQGGPISRDRRTQACVTRARRGPLTREQSARAAAHTFVVFPRTHGARGLRDAGTSHSGLPLSIYVADGRYHVGLRSSRSLPADRELRRRQSAPSGVRTSNSRIARNALARFPRPWQNAARCSIADGRLR